MLNEPYEFCFCFPVNAGSLRDETDANFLIENFQDLLTRATLHQFAVKLQTLDCFATPNTGTQIQRLVFRGVILAELRLRDDNMFNLRSRQGRSSRGVGLATDLVHQYIRSGI
jgi:hypothetical protein